MSIWEKLFKSHKESDPVFEKVEAAKLTQEAFFLVEKHKFSEAIKCLEKAIKVYPKCGDAYNELGFVHGKCLGKLDLAEQYARKATECDPDNPKFWNSLMFIRNHRIKHLKTRHQIREHVAQTLEEVEQTIQDNPKYAPAYLSKALALALRGESIEIWIKELKRAEQIYIENIEGGHGLRLDEHKIKQIIERNKKECFEMVNIWEKLPLS